MKKRRAKKLLMTNAMIAGLSTANLIVAAVAFLGLCGSHVTGPTWEFKWRSERAQNE